MLPEEESRLSEDEDYLDLGDLSGVPDEHTVPGAEYELAIVTLEKRPQKKSPQKKMLYIQFELPEDPLSKLITHTIMLPHPEDDKRTFTKRERAVRYFYEAFDIPLSGGVKLSDYVGNKGWVLLREETTDEFGDQNRISRFVRRG